MHLTIQQLVSNKTAICGQQNSGQLPGPAAAAAKKQARLTPRRIPYLRGRKPAPSFPLCPVISSIRTIFPFTAVFHFPLFPVISPIRTIFPFTAVFHFPLCPVISSIRTFFPFTPVFHFPLFPLISSSRTIFPFTANFFPERSGAFPAAPFCGVPPEWQEEEQLPQSPEQPPQPPL